jgi:hypothetical protein
MSSPVEYSVNHIHILSGNLVGVSIVFAKGHSLTVAFYLSRVQQVDL